MSKIKTWIYEAIVVAIVLLIVWFSTGHRFVEFIGCMAVFLTFMHAQIADRMQEKQAKQIVPDVKCHWKMNYYFVGKELLWITFFIMNGAWSAITGAVLFCLYPLWRKIYRKYKPLA